MNPYGKKKLMQSEAKKGEAKKGEDEDFLTVDLQADEDDYENVQIEIHEQDTYDNIENEDQYQQENIYANS